MLKGIRVVDFTRHLPGPYATLRLADMGAEVIKVESPQYGDPARQMGAGLVFLANNRDKKSVTIDLKKQEGQEIAFQLACQADVVLEGFRPGVAEALGIGYQGLKHVRPDIIYCSLTGYGQTSPLNDLGGHDLNFMALSGILSQLRDQHGRVVQPGIQFADMIGGIVASEAVLAALIKKEWSGEGAYLDISMTDALIGMMTSHVVIQQATGQENGLPELGGKIISYFLYETKDGRFISLGALEKKFWENFCRAVGQEKWMEEQFSPTVEENQTFREIKGLFKSRTFAEWSQFSQEIDCCMAPVLDTGELRTHFHTQAKELLAELESDAGERWRQAATSAGGFELQQRKASNRIPPPILGQHNQEIFQEWLQVSPEQIEAWKQKGIV